MPRVRLNDKFTYHNELVQLYLPTRATHTYPANENIYQSTDFRTDFHPIHFPTFEYPTVGTTHANRVGNRITVTSVRCKLILKLNEQFLRNSGDPMQQTGTVASAPAPKRFFKLRYFLLQVDDDLASQVNELWIYKWFKRSYCWYKPATTPITTDWSIAPVSVHSNILHSTTEYVAKFNILCDKCFTLTSAKPQISFDITVPLNKEFCWDETDTTALIYPHIYMFILPPLSSDIDMDAITSLQYYSTPTITKICDIYEFTKLSFVDL